MYGIVLYSPGRAMILYFNLVPVSDLIANRTEEWISVIPSGTMVGGVTGIILSDSR